MPSAFNAPILDDVDEVFAHVFRENPDKSISYLSSFSSNAGQIKETIKNVMTEFEISSECYIGFHNEENGHEIMPFVEFSSKKINLKLFKKFSNIVFSLEGESKILD